jgi:hypothetical protein
MGWPLVTYERAPDHLKPRMLVTLERFRRHIAEGGLYCRGCDNSIGHWSLQGGLCERCWEREHPGESYFGRKPRVAR